MDKNEAVKQEKRKEKKQFKSPNTYVILFVVILIVAVLSWFIPGGKYDLNKEGQAISGTYHLVKSNPQGIWEVLMAPIIGMIGNDNISGAIGISLFIMLFGGFLELMDEAGSVKLFLKKVTIQNRNNMHQLIAILVVMMGIFGTTEGADEEGIAYLMMFLPIILGLGLDTMVAVMIVVLGTQGGCLASTINPFSVGIASEIAGISPGEGLLMRSIMFVVIMTIIIIYICRYADKIKADPEKSVQFYRREEDLKEFPVALEDNVEMTKEQKKVLAMFVALFIVLIISLIPWDSLNPNWTFFIDIKNFITSIPYIGTVIGKGLVPFGQWYFNELSMLLLLFTIICGFIMHYDISKTINILMKGAGNLVPTAFIVPFARGIQVVMNDGLITPTILHLGESTLSSLPPIAFVIVSLLFYIAIAAFIPSSTGLAAATMSIMASLARFANIPEHLMITVFLIALGLVKMIMPTSIVVMTCTQATHISYAAWVKFMWKFIIFLFMVCCIFLIIGTMFI